MVLRRLICGADMAWMQNLLAAEMSGYGGTKGVKDRRLPYLEPASLDAFTLPGLRQSAQVRRILRGALLPIAGRLLRSATCFMHPNIWARAMPPEDAAYLATPAVHQDYVEIQASKDCLTFWVPLFDVEKESGVLRVYHSVGQRRTLPMMLTSDSPNGWEVDPAFLGSEYCPNLCSGDVLCFDALTPHGNAVNPSLNWRVSLEVRVQRMGDPLSGPCLQPYAPGDDLHNYGPTPLVIDFDPVWESWREIEALAQGERGNRRSLRSLEIVATTSPRNESRTRATRLLEQMESEDE